jgi:putative sugar O-methyltransferase
MEEHTRTVAPAGAYWDAIAARIRAQVLLRGGRPPWYSADCHYAAAFSGAPFNGIAVLADEMANSKWGWLSKKIENALIRLKLDPRLLPFLWKPVLRRQQWLHYASVSAQHYEMLVRAMAVMFKDEIERWDIRSPEAFGPDLVDIGGRKLSWKTLWEFTIFLRMKKLSPNPADAVVEIGSGVGELGRLFLATGSAKTYYFVDIPPGLAFSQTYLSSIYPAEKIGAFDPARGPIAAGEGKACYFLTPDQIPLIPKADLGLNVGSFGEMSQNIVSGYAAALKALNIREFISINHRIKKTNNPETLGEREYSAYFGPELKIDGRASFFSHTPCAELLEDAPGKPGYQILRFARD